MIRVLLGLLPPSFRRRYGSEMTVAFEARVREARSRGAASWCGVWLRTVPDVLVTAGAEWARETLASSWLDDVRLAARTLRRRPVLSGLLAVTVALGVGANTAMFSAVHAVLLRPLPVDDPDALVRVWSRNPEAGQERFFVAPVDFDVLEAEVDEAHGFAGWFPTEASVVGDDGVAIRIATVGVTPDLFDLLGVEAALGRTFAPDDAVGGEGGSREPEGVVLTRRGWERLFGADPAAVGRAVPFATGGAAPVVGVLPGRLDWLLGEADLVFPFAELSDQASYRDRWMHVVARRGSGVDDARFAEALEAVHRGIRADDPTRAEGWTFRVEPLHASVAGEAGALLWTLLGSSGLVLLVVCANLAGLLLGRAEERGREVALRAALGAGRSRLARQLSTEATLLVALAGAAGVVVAEGLLRALIALASGQVPRLEGAALSAPVLIFSAALVGATALGAGLAPALRLARATPGRILGERPRGVGRSRREGLRGVFVAGQLAVSTTLVVGAGLLLGGLRTLGATDPGFDGAGVVAVELTLPVNAYADPAEVAAFFDALLRAAGDLPGVAAVGLTSEAPFGPRADYPAPIRREGQGVGAFEAPRPWFRQVDEGFFAALGAETVDGRTFRRADDARAEGVVVVNRAAAHLLWPGGAPVGRILEGAGQQFGPLGVMLHDRVRVVGVVDDLRYRDLGGEALPSLYFPFRQAPFRRMSVVLRTVDATAPALDGFREAVAHLDPAVGLSEAWSLDAGRRASFAPERLTALLFTAFAGLALALAVVGLYGVTRQAVVRRRGELGIRRALGAGGARLVGSVLGRTGRVVVAGLTAGALVTVVGGRFLAGRLHGVSFEPGVLGATAVLLAGVTLAAGLVPALRAVRSAPADCLRSE